MEDCIFCNRELIKEDIIYETENFYVKVGFGIVTPGHILLIPKKHFDCFADLPNDLFYEFEKLKDLIFNKIKENFLEPLMIEYGVWGQSVNHAHIHFIPKIRKKTLDYDGYELVNITEDMIKISKFNFILGDYKKAKEIRKKYGGYVYLEDKKKYIVPEVKNETGRELGYRTYFNKILKIKDVPINWKNISEEDKIIDEKKRQETKDILKF